MSNLFEDLNEKQKEAVMATEGKVRVIAGAGTGKTHVIARRFAYLVNEKGVNPSNILCITFTNKEALELRNSIEKMVHHGYVYDTVCTIPGFCLKVLRRDIHRMGYPKNFVISYYKDAAKHALGIQDLQCFAHDLLNTYEDVRTYWQDKLHYIMVDDAQDYCKSDWELINAVSEKNHNLFMAGDPNQTIYECKGALPKYFVDDEVDKEIVLNENYRSTPNILEVANSIIKRNEGRVKNDLFTKQATGANVVYYHARTEQREIDWIDNKINELKKHGVRNSEIVVLYRESYSRIIEQFLCWKKVNYKFYGDRSVFEESPISFFDRKEIKEAVAYCRLANNRDDDLSFLRIVNVPSRGFGAKALELLKELSLQEGTSLYQTLLNHKHDKKFDKEPLHVFINLIEESASKLNDCGISEIIDYLVTESGLRDKYQRHGDEDRIHRVNHLNGLINDIRLYESVEREEKATVDTYLQDVSLFTYDDYRDEGDSVKLMTIHQAKGLEFPFVFICGMSEGLFPSFNAIQENGNSGLEEERRLMHVAVTRTKQALFLSDSEGIDLENNVVKRFPSRFLVEIKENLLQVEGDNVSSLFTATEKLVNAGIQMRGSERIEHNSPKYKEGVCVTHKTFGAGVIESCESDESGKVFCVRFASEIRCLKYDDLDEMTNGPEDWIEEPYMGCLLKTKLQNMNLSTRTMNVFEKNGIMTFEDLVRYTKDELKDLRGFGKTCMSEIVDLLESLNLCLGYDVDPIINRYNIYMAFARERREKVLPILKTPLSETRILNTDFFNKLIKLDIRTIKDLILHFHYPVRSYLQPDEVAEVLVFLKEKGIYIIVSPYYNSFSFEYNGVNIVKLEELFWDSPDMTN